MDRIRLTGLSAIIMFAASPAICSNWQHYATIATGHTQNKHVQDVRLLSTPVPGVVNQYRK